MRILGGGWTSTEGDKRMTTSFQAAIMQNERKERKVETQRPRESGGRRKGNGEMKRGGRTVMTERAILVMRLGRPV